MPIRYVDVWGYGTTLKKKTLSMLLITIMDHGATEQSPSNSCSNASLVQKAVPPGPPVQKSEAIPPDIYITSRYVTACDKFYQAFPCVSILQVTNAGLETMV